MTPTANPLSLKDRIEITLCNLYLSDPTLVLLNPLPQNAEDRPAKPSLTVEATVGKEICPGLGVFRATVATELSFNAKASEQDSVALDEAAKLIHDLHKTAQATGIYGLIRDGETQVFEGAIDRKRIIHCRVIGA